MKYNQRGQSQAQTITHSVYIFITQHRATIDVLGLIYRLSSGTSSATLGNAIIATTTRANFFGTINIDVDTGVGTQCRWNGTSQCIIK